ncbi:response regulator [Glaciimonas sp. Gout2]|uniref:response regulator n=1 Tax=unclassified Glaciimonas TaxID=2644401 RepID=UPI002AB5355A|nr:MULTISPECIES: response regulator [unclassified Glaciimonas]MDY7547900.1 response regulator [Glaciimonas sp. CA11.2]MEB0010073.1 response regulator [Glaciimonas sp. Cout2]MEB0081812.1 response regulator [Glaciimonas sp. Gout2]
MNPKVLIVTDSMAESLTLHETVVHEASGVWSTYYAPQGIELFGEVHPDVLILSFSNIHEAEHFIIMLSRECDHFLDISCQILLLCGDDQLTLATALYPTGPFDALLPGRPLLDPIMLKSAVDQGFHRRQSVIAAREFSLVSLGMPLSTSKLILVIDDDVTYSDMLQHALYAGGYEVIAARDGLQALSILRNCTPSLILLDIVMPHIDGISILTQIKNSDSLGAIPVIVHTGMTVQEVFDDAKKYNATGLLSKPVDRATLLRKIDACLLNDTFDNAIFHTSTTSTDAFSAAE